jgi:hypothetical protein
MGAVQSPAGGAAAAHAPGVGEHNDALERRWRQEGEPGLDIFTRATSQGATKFDKPGFKPAGE